MYRELHSLRQVLQQELKDTLPPLPGLNLNSYSIRISIS